MVETDETMKQKRKQTLLTTMTRILSLTSCELRSERVDFWFDKDCEELCWNVDENLLTCRFVLEAERMEPCRVT